MPFDQPSVRSVFGAIKQGFCIAEMVLDDDGEPIDYRFLEVNPEFESMTGLSDPVNKTALQLVPTLERRWIESYGRVGLGRETLRFSQGSDAMGRWFDVVAVPVEPHGRFAIVFEDVTKSHVDEIAVRSAEQFMGRVLNQLPAFVAVLSPEGLVQEINRVPLVSGGIQPEEVLGKPFWECSWWNHSASVTRSIRLSIERAALGRESQFDVQIQVRDGVLQWVDYQISPVVDSHQTVTHLVPVAHDIGERIAAEQAMLAALQNERETRRRVELLQLTATRFAAVGSRFELGEVLLQSLRSSLDIDLAAVNFLIDGTIEIVASNSADPGAVERFQHAPLDVHLPGTVAIRENRQVVLSSRRDIETEFPLVNAAKYELEAVVAVPLNDSEGVAIGAIVLGCARAEWATSANLELLVAISRQAGLVVERVLLLERLVRAAQREHEIALRLQESLLPRSLVSNLSLTLAAHYSAAADLMAVGGDWYDTFQWGDRYVALVVGDVAGHDLDATTKMGRLSGGVSALASGLQPRPDAVLDAYNHCAHLNDVGFATAACVVIDTEMSSVEYSLAGHLPPLLVLPDGELRWLDRALVSPLGSHQRSHLRERCSIESGSSILLYSDGLIERRNESIDVGLERLRATVAKHRGLQMHDLLRAITKDMVGEGGPSDDIIVLLAEYISAT